MTKKKVIIIISIATAAVFTAVLVLSLAMCNKDVPIDVNVFSYESIDVSDSDEPAATLNENYIYPDTRVETLIMYQTILCHLAEV